MDALLRRTTPAQEGEDEFDSYINDPSTTFRDIDSAIDWLLDSQAIPHSISRQAIDLLCIPAMSAELERVLSEAKFTVACTRNRMSNTTFEKHGLLRHWWVNETIE